MLFFLRGGVAQEVISPGGPLPNLDVLRGPSTDRKLFSILNESQKVPLNMLTKYQRNMQTTKSRTVINSKPLNEGSDFVAYPVTKSLGISLPRPSAISLLPMLAVHCRARLTWTGLGLARSFFMDLMTSLIRSLLALIITEINKYP